MNSRWLDNEMLAFDLESTGIDRYHDIPVSFALVSMIGGRVVRSVEGLVDPAVPVPASALAIHGLSDDRLKAEGRPLREAIALIAHTLIDASERGVPVVGFNLSYDLTMIDSRMVALGGPGLLESGWHGPVLDPLVLDRALRRTKGRRRLSDVCRHYGVVNPMAHDATADAVAAAGLLGPMVEAFPVLGQLSLENLTERQVEWHHSWARNLDEYFAGRDRGSRFRLHPGDGDWPISGQSFSAA
jgi:DNA polymerase-3 subunit epsilon